MKKLTQKILVLNGAKRRIGDIKSIFQNIEYNNQLLHTSLISTNNCVTFLYSWGHIIIYTFPQEQIITVDCLHQIGYSKIDQILKTVVDVFRPNSHKIKEINRC